MEVARTCRSARRRPLRLSEFERARRAIGPRAGVSATSRSSQAGLLLKEAMIPYRLGRYPQALRWLDRGLRGLDGIEGIDGGAQRARLFVWCGTIRSTSAAVPTRGDQLVPPDDRRSRAVRRPRYPRAGVLHPRLAYLALGAPEEAVSRSRRSRSTKSSETSTRPASSSTTSATWPTSRAGGTRRSTRRGARRGGDGRRQTWAAFAAFNRGDPRSTRASWTRPSPSFAMRCAFSSPRATISRSQWPPATWGCRQHGPVARRGGESFSWRPRVVRARRRRGRAVDDRAALSSRWCSRVALRAPCARRSASRRSRVRGGPASLGRHAPAAPWLGAGLLDRPSRECTSRTRGGLARRLRDELQHPEHRLRGRAGARPARRPRAADGEPPTDLALDATAIMDRLGVVAITEALLSDTHGAMPREAGSGEGLACRPSQRPLERCYPRTVVVPRVQVLDREDRRIVPREVSCSSRRRCRSRSAARPAGTTAGTAAINLSICLARRTTGASWVAVGQDPPVEPAVDTGPLPVQDPAFALTG